MTNKKRPWFPGAALHITARGNHRNDIFRDQEDFQVYYTFLQEALEHFKEKFDIYSYCLMNNHVHILVGMFRLYLIALKNFLDLLKDLSTQFLETIC